MRPAPFVAISVGLAIAAAVFLLVWPVYSGYSAGRPTVATLLQVNGGWALVPVTFPVVVALIPAVFAKKAIRILAAVVMSVFAFVAMMSIGLFYVPAAILMVLAACIPDPAARQRHAESS